MIHIHLFLEKQSNKNDLLLMLTKMIKERPNPSIAVYLAIYSKPVVRSVVASEYLSAIDVSRSNNSKIPWFA